MSSVAPKINLAEMSDDEISNMDPSALEDTLETEQEKETGTQEQTDSEETQNQNVASDPATENDNDTDDTGGAESVADSLDVDLELVAPTSEEESTDTGTADPPEDSTEHTSASNQEADSGSVKESDTDTASGEVDYKSEYSRIMAPFKAAKREVKVDSVEDARRLMQMGVDYARKMEAMKPYRKVLKTLENNNLIDVDKINFLIDLDKKNPEAIRKFLKDSEVDPMDLDLEDNVDYSPTDHIVGDDVIALDDVIDEIRGTESFERTAKIITSEWDSDSRKILMDNPAVIAIINDHVGVGIFDQISGRMENEKLLGRLAGLSDLEAYKAVGDAMHEKGEFNLPNQNESSSSGNTTQGHSQDSGSKSADADTLRNRKRAASPTKGTASARKTVPNFLAMSDEDIEKFDINSL